MVFFSKYGKFMLGIYACGFVSSVAYHTVKKGNDCLMEAVGKSPYLTYREKLSTARQGCLDGFFDGYIKGLFWPVLVVGDSLPRYLVHRVSRNQR